MLTAPSAHRQAAVEIGELRGNDGEVVCLGLGPGLRAFPLAQRIVLGEPSRGCRRELRLRLDSVRSCDRTSCGRRFEADPWQPVDPRHEDRRSGKQLRACRPVAQRAQLNASGELARNGGPADQGARSQQHGAPVRQLAQGEQNAARDDPLVRSQLDDDRLLLHARDVQARIDAGRKDPEVARETLLRRVADGGRQGDQQVEARQELLAQRPRGRVAEPVRRREGRNRERVRVAERKVREGGKPGIEAVDDVEAALLERLAQVRLHSDRDAQLRPRRDRDRRPHRDHVGALAA